MLILISTFKVNDNVWNSYNIIQIIENLIGTMIYDIHIMLLLTDIILTFRSVKQISSTTALIISLLNTYIVSQLPPLALGANKREANISAVVSFLQREIFSLETKSRS